MLHAIVCKNPWLSGTLAVIMATVVTACTAPDRPPGAKEPAAIDPVTFDLSRFEIVDLTYSFDENTLYWPTSPSSFELEQLAYGPSAAGFFYSANAICTPEHGGTHLDAPIHFAADRWTADEIPLERLVGPGVVIHVAAKASADTDYRLTREDIAAWETQHGEIPSDAIVLLHTGWGTRWPDRKRYLGDDTPGDASNLHFPSYGAEAAKFLIEERRIAVLGVDTASIDHGPSSDFIVHQIANGANVPGLENVAHLDQVPPIGAWIFALPMKIAGGSGGPVRIMALVPIETPQAQ